MCGLNGIFSYHPSAGLPDVREVLATRDYMRARGPDGSGLWWSQDRRCVLAHRRLAVIDLSNGGAQPMVSEDEFIVVTYNGEIYNYPELRAELERDGVIFRSDSDTEVLLHLYRRFGFDMVLKLRGMFAFAIWDDKKSGLFLARDPYGIKPLYTANDGWTFRFASQVKALLAGGGVSRDPKSAGIVGFHLLGTVPEPFTLYREIFALPAGHTQWVDRKGGREPEAYHSISAVLAKAGSQKNGSGGNTIPRAGGGPRERACAFAGRRRGRRFSVCGRRFRCGFGPHAGVDERPYSGDHLGFRPIYRDGGG